MNSRSAMVYWKAKSYTYASRKEYQYAQIGRQLNQFNIRRYQLSKLPTVNLNGNYSKSAQRDKWNFLGKGDWFTISSVNLNINIPIFNGFYTKAKIEQAKIDLQKTDNEIADLKLNIDNEVATARNNFRSCHRLHGFSKRKYGTRRTGVQPNKKEI